MKLEQRFVVLFSVVLGLYVSDQVIKADSISVVEEDQPASEVIHQPYAATPTRDAVNSIQHTINTNDNNPYKTYAYIPESCNVHNKHVGNYQGGIQIGNNLYLVEHNQLPNLTHGNLVKIDLASYNRLGLNQTGHAGDIVKAFRYFNCKTLLGKQHQRDFNHFPKRQKRWLKKIQQKNRKLLKRSSEFQAQNKTIDKLAKQKQRLIKQSKRTKIKKSTKKDFKNKLKMVNFKMKLINKEHKELNRQLKHLQGKIGKLDSKIRNGQSGQTIATRYAAIKSLVQVGPTITTGHGQSIGYDSKNNRLFILNNLSSNRRVALEELDQQTLKIKHTLATNALAHTLAFDNNGNAFFVLNHGTNHGVGSCTIFQGQVNGSSLNFKPILKISHSMIGVNQFLAYNSKNNSLYMVTDGKTVSVPVDKLLNHTVRTADLHATIFESGKEFENLSFDQAVYGYLMTNRTPEILKSSRPV